MRGITNGSTSPAALILRGFTQGLHRLVVTSMPIRGLHARSTARSLITSDCVIMVLSWGRACGFGYSEVNPQKTLAENFPKPAINRDRDKKARLPCAAGLSLSASSLAATLLESNALKRAIIESGDYR